MSIWPSFTKTLLKIVKSFLSLNPIDGHKTLTGLPFYFVRAIVFDLT